MDKVIRDENGNIIEVVFVEDDVEDDGVSINDVVSDIQNKRKPKSNKKKIDIFDREPMRATATVFTVSGLAVATIAVIGGLDLFIGVGLALLAFFMTMMAKGSRASKYCVVLAVIDMGYAATLLVIKLKSLGIFDWLHYSMK